MKIVDDAQRSIRSAWAYIKDFGVALGPMRFGILGLVLIFLVWFETYTGQGRDVLVHYAKGGWGHFFWLVGATLVFAVTVWLAMYLAVLVRFEEEKEIMIDYRTFFPAADYTHENEEVRTAAAEKRVDWILRWRKWMPLVLGASGPVLTGFFLIFAADALAKGLVCLAFAVVFILIALPVQLLFGREDPKKSWRENTKESLHALVITPRELIEQPLDEKTKTAWKEVPRPLRVFALCLSGGILIVLILCAIDPVKWGLLLGPALVLFIAISFIVVIGTLLAIGSRESHLPLFSLVVTGLVVTHCAGYDSAVRYVKHDNAKQEIEARPSPEKAFVDWWDKHKPDKPKPESGSAEGAAAAQSGGTNKPVPIVFVATAGGGSRAAYWTATVLGTLEDKTRREFSNHLFAISGVSGGSLGAAIFRTLVTLPPEKMNGRSYATVGQEAAAGDFLGPVLAILFTQDLLPSIYDINAPVAPEQDWIFHGDRAVALERSWEAKWDEAVCRGKRPCANLMAESFLNLFKEKPVPALLLNGTAVETGARIVTSNLKIECETAEGAKPCTQIRDASDLLTHIPKPDLGVRVSTAVSNSARFPFIGPAAVTPIALQPVADPNKGAPPILARIVDGGYFENFAASTLRELLAALDNTLKKEDRKLLPIVVQISSDPELDTKRDPGYGRPVVGQTKIGRFLAQLRSPLNVAFNTRDAHGVQSRLALWDTAEHLNWDKVTEMPGRYFHFRLCQRGAPLAWVLSDQAQENLKNALSGCEKNQQQMDELTTLISSMSSSDKIPR